MRVLIVAIALWSSTGCLRKTLYKCSDSTQCGTDGLCEDTGFCSFPDSKCTSGRRYGEYSAEDYSSQCVGEISNPPIDAPGDTIMSDTMLDGPVTVGCPGTYTITVGTHKYRAITANGDWTTQKNACAADGSNAYLAIPDDQTELDQILTSTPGARAWVGITSGANTGADSFQTLKGVTFADNNSLWENGEPDHKSTTNNTVGNCVQADDNNNTLVDEDCSKGRPALCECEP